MQKKSFQEKYHWPIVFILVVIGLMAYYGIEMWLNGWLR